MRGRFPDDAHVITGNHKPIMVSRTLPRYPAVLRKSYPCTRTVTVMDSWASPIRMPDTGAASR